MHFKSEFGNSIELYGDRKSIFENKVRGIIAHNSNPANTWKKGINRYSEMTHEEFVEYYHIVGDNQECAAT